MPCHVGALLDESQCQEGLVGIWGHPWHLTYEVAMTGTWGARQGARGSGRRRHLGEVRPCGEPCSMALRGVVACGGPCGMALQGVVAGGGPCGMALQGAVGLVAGPGKGMW